MKNLAIIPARGGSKRIPRKNIKPFLGKPIIAYSIETAKQTCLFQEIMVSTDDYEIAEIAQNYGASVPFMRSNETSTDTAHIAQIVEEVLNKYSNLNMHFDNICCIFATAPLMKANKIIEAYNLLLNNNYDSVFPVVPFSYPIQRALRIRDGKAQMFYPEYIFTRSQDLEIAYHDAGQFYWMKTNEFLKQKRFFSNNAGVIILSQLEAQDIDNEDDWKIAELKYKMINAQ
ncbi:MAG: pseudaminic acid cytidylyltransferase [Bacteroidales bacterium]|nr:pseudaminic acid cytidylyltransferase [Bacteroidales bacterium]